MRSREHGPVLVVDDNEDVRDIMTLFLRRRGHEAVTAENGEEALERLRNGIVPCLIVLDLMMPVKDGFAFRREQLADPDLASIPVIIFSGHSDVQRANRELQALDVLSKPSSLAELADLIMRHCGSSPH